MEREAKQRLVGYFRQFDSTLALADKLIREKSHPQEILLLLCSRLDALACAGIREGDPRKKAFVEFVQNYGGDRRLFESVSVGDLYYEVVYHLWLLPGMIGRPGRVRCFSRVNEPIIKVLDESGIGLTEREAAKLLGSIGWGLRKHFRAAPGQRRKKKLLASVPSVLAAVLRELRGRHNGVDPIGLQKGLGGLVRAKTLSAVLYERFRCEVIHGGKVVLDEARFFTERGPYWKTLRSEYCGPFMLVEFPARFLAELLRKCLRAYSRHLMAANKIPPDIFFQMFPEGVLTGLELLDENLLPKERVSGATLPRG